MASKEELAGCSLRRLSNEGLLGYHGGHRFRSVVVTANEKELK
jgi:hypothetical protein